MSKIGKTQLTDYSYANCNSFSKSINNILTEIPFVGKGKKVKISNTPSVFDIETSSFYKEDQKQCCMYAWVFGINGKCICGRTWGEFINIIDTVIKHYNISLEKRFIIYVHNLSYEFQFMKRYFEWEKVFSIDQRKPIYAITKSGIEFRCSYLLSGYSLEKLGENLTKYKVEKKVGDLDYTLIRHSKTPLTDKEWGYILNDGLVVMSYIQEEIERMGSIAKLPLTKTGYVRNLCRDKCLKGENKFEYSKKIKTLTLTVDEYNQLKRAYTGGFTHANSKYVNKTIYDVHSFDETSAYPAVMLSELYPMTSPFRVPIHSAKDFEKCLKNYCCMFDVTFYELMSTCSFENYISKSRCTELEHFIVNNGRIVEASKLTVTLTEQDFFIISKMYKWNKIEISNMNCFRKGYLPKDFILTILELYRDKTSLKGVVGKEVEYLVAKGMINSCYGMCVTDPCRDENLYDNDDVWKVTKADVESMLEAYNKSNTRFLYYAWGVWVTAYARRNLFKAILEFKDDYVYSDTDSIKGINIDKHKTFIEEYNKKIQKKIEECLKYYNIPTKLAYPKTVKGIEKPLGIWEYEGKYNRFKTLGAKRYLTESNGKLSITIAGVGKNNGIEYLLHKYKTNDCVFEAFEENLHFPSNYDCNGIEKCGSGKMCHTYIDIYMEGEIVDYMGNVYVYNEQSGVHLENTDYTMSLDFDFLQLLKGIRSSHIC